MGISRGHDLNIAEEVTQQEAVFDDTVKIEDADDDINTSEKTDDNQEPVASESTKEADDATEKDEKNDDKISLTAVLHNGTVYLFPSEIAPLLPTFMMNPFSDQLMEFFSIKSIPVELFIAQQMMNKLAEAIKNDATSEAKCSCTKGAFFAKPTTTATTATTATTTQEVKADNSSQASIPAPKM